MVEELCYDIYALFFSESKVDIKKRRLKMVELGGYFFHNPITLNSLKPVCELERKLLTVKGTHKSYIEDQLFYILTEAALQCTAEDVKGGCITLNEKRINQESKKSTRERYRMALYCNVTAWRCIVSLLNHRGKREI